MEFQLCENPQSDPAITFSRPTNDLRDAQLESYENFEKQRARGKKIKLHELLRALVTSGYTLRTSDQKQDAIVRLLYFRLLSEPGQVVAEVREAIFDKCVASFLSLLKSACPNMADNSFERKIP
jgi:hypothetical protein